MTHRILGFVLLASAGSDACGQSAGTPGGIGAIASILPEGRNGVWVGEKSGSVYRMSNAEDPGTLQYYFLDPVPGTEGRRTIAVRIAISSVGKDTHAGLVYGVTATPTTYYYYLLEPDGRVILFRREPDASLTEVMTTRVQSRTGEFVTLGIEENGNEARFLVNGVQAGTHRADDVGRGGAGIAAGGTGEFAFASFQHDPAPIIPGSSFAASKDGGRPGDGPGAVPAGWRRHETPGVFTISHPQEWRVSFDAQNGYVQLAGNGNEQVAIWPVHSGRPLDPPSATVLLTRLASRLVPDASWGQGSLLDRNTVRLESRVGGRTTVASLRWVSNGNGSAAFCYVSSAPAERYDAQSATIASILASFRPLIPEQARRGAGSPAPRSSVAFTRWQDPAEGAFQVEVPQGWRVDGGLRRYTAIDYRRGVSVTSADGELNVFFMDPGIPAFTLPDQTTAVLGQQEGTWYTAPDGTRMMIRRYAPGAGFAREYITGRFGSALANGRIDRQQDRPDIAAVVEQEFTALNEAGGGLIRHQAAAGEVRFSGQRSGRPYVGYVSATTVLAAFQMGGGVWEVRQLYGLMAPTERVGEAAEVLQRLVASFQWNPQWYMRQHQTRAAVSEIMVRHGRQMGEIIGGTFAEAGRRADRTADRFSEYVRGTVTLEDEQGARFEVWNSSNYYWMDVFNDVTGTMLSPNPDVSRFRELVVVR